MPHEPAESQSELTGRNGPDQSQVVAAGCQAVGSGFPSSVYPSPYFPPVLSACRPVALPSPSFEFRSGMLYQYNPVWPSSEPPRYPGGGGIFKHLNYACVALQMPRLAGNAAIQAVRSTRWSTGGRCPL